MKIQLEATKKEMIISQEEIKVAQEKRNKNCIATTKKRNRWN